MKYFIAGLCLCALLSLCSCGGGTIFTPEFVDPADTSSPVSSAPSSSAPEVSSDPTGESSASSSEESSAFSSAPESQPDPDLTISEESWTDLWQEETLCRRYTLRCKADGLAGAGELIYDLVSLPEEHPAAEAFNAYYQQDLEEWRNSVLSTARDNALLAREAGEQAQPYSISLTASVLIRGGVISVSRQGLQAMGEEALPFAAGNCFDAADGHVLSLWDLFSVSQEEAADCVLEALTEAAREQQQELGLREDSWQQLAGYFSPADFSCSGEGFLFFLPASDLAENPDGGLLTVEVPYSAFSGMLAYPLEEG